LNDLKNYIKNQLGLDLILRPVEEALQNKLPLYLREGYSWQKATLDERPCIFAIIEAEHPPTIAQITKNFAEVRKLLALPVIAVFTSLEAFNRQRLIQNKIAFIVTGRQLYIPDFLISLKEYRDKVTKEETMTPIAQLIFLFHLLFPDQTLKNKTFKELAVFFGTNRIGVSRAVSNLRRLNLVEVRGEKEKFIYFCLKRSELWKEAKDRGLMVDPVQRRVFVDEKPEGTPLLKSNISALSEYSDINPGEQTFYAIEKNMFFALQKNQILENANKWEGKYCLEVWKYDPQRLVGETVTVTEAVDPLSLYLSMKESRDERIEMALEQIERKFIWYED
jgi:hypothetical protein